MEALTSLQLALLDDDVCPLCLGWLNADGTRCLTCEFDVREYKVGVD